MEKSKFSFMKCFSRETLMLWVACIFIAIIFLLSYAKVAMIEDVARLRFIMDNPFVSALHMGAFAAIPISLGFSKDGGDPYVNYLCGMMFAFGTCSALFFNIATGLVLLLSSSQILIRFGIPFDD